MPNAQMTRNQRMRLAEYGSSTRAFKGKFKRALDGEL